MRLLHFILSHSVFIACCAAGLCYQSTVLLHLPLNTDLYIFTFFATLCSYNFYWLLSKFYFSERKFNASFIKKNLSFILIFMMAAAGMLLFIFRLPGIIPYVAGGVALTLIYSLPLWPLPFSKKLQKAGFFKTTLLSLTWSYVTVALPAAGVIQASTVPVFSLFIARFFLLLLLCIIFDMRDISVDKMHGLHSLATDISRKRLKIIIGIVFICYIAAGLFVRAYFRDDPQLLAFALTGILVWAVYRLSLRRRGYIFYYFVVDGMMLVSVLFTHLATLV